MDVPGDGDGSAIDDGLLAEVIPLRRRGGGDAWQQAHEPPPSDIFEPPPEPEPPGEYSVWDTPTAELVRREPARARRPLLLTLPHPAHRVRWLALAALGAVGFSVIALSMLSLGRSGRSPVAVGQLGSPAGLGRTLGGVATSHRARDGNATSQRRARGHAPAAVTRRHRGTSQTLLADHVSPSANANANADVTVAYSSPSSAPPVNGARSQSGGAGPGTPAVARAAREFGFEP